jgi:hypothetical protein
MQAAAETDEIFLMRFQYVSLIGRKHTKELFQSTDAKSQNKNVPKQQINVARKITTETSICLNFFSLPAPLHQLKRGCSSSDVIMISWPPHIQADLSMAHLSARKARILVTSTNVFLL